MEINKKNCKLVAITVLLVWLIIHYWDVCTHIVGLGFGAALPLIIGCVIAYVVNILMSTYEKLFLKYTKKCSQKIIRPLSMLLAFLSIFLIIFIIARMIIPEMVSCVQILLRELPKTLEEAYIWAEENFEISQYFDSASQLKNSSMDVQKIVSNALNVLITGVGGALELTFGIVTSVFSAMATLLIACIFSIYLLSGKEKILGQCSTLCHHFLPEKWWEKLSYVLHVLHESFHSFIVGQCIEAVILGTLCMIGMLILRLPYAAMVGSLIGFTALIPIAGAYIGACVGAFLIFTVSPIKAVVFVIFLVILQQIEGNLIYPKVVGTAIGLPGIWVLAAVVVGGGTLGVPGMLLGVPIASAVYRLLKEKVEKPLTK